LGGDNINNRQPSFVIYDLWFSIYDWRIELGEVESLNHKSIFSGISITAMLTFLSDLCIIPFSANFSF